MSNVLSEADKVRIRHHMGYPQMLEVARFALGLPATFETAFLIERAMDLVKQEAVPLVQALLARLDAIEAQMAEDEELLAVDKVGEIDIREDEQESLDKRYDRWLGKLENALSCERNPNDRTGGGGGGINAPVRHSSLLPPNLRVRH